MSITTWWNDRKVRKAQTDKAIEQALRIRLASLDPVKDKADYEAVSKALNDAERRTNDRNNSKAFVRKCVAGVGIAATGLLLSFDTDVKGKLVTKVYDTTRRMGEGLSGLFSGK